MKLHRYVDHQRLHIVTKDVISLSISVLLLFRHDISHKITFGAPSSGGVLRSACGAFIVIGMKSCTFLWVRFWKFPSCKVVYFYQMCDVFFGLYNPFHPLDPRRPLHMLYMFIATYHCPKGILGLGGEASKTN